MTPQGTYLPSASKVRDQVEAYERSGGQEANTFTGLPVIIVTMRGTKSGSIRKKALMRVEHDGEYAPVLQRSERRAILSGTTTSRPIRTRS